MNNMENKKVFIVDDDKFLLDMYSVKFKEDGFDVEVGVGANVGAGTITVNYDGYTKHRTVIKDGARIGSDTMLVAPVTIGENAFTGAGSTISRDVSDGALAVERAKQKEIPGYAAKREERHRRELEES